MEKKFVIETVTSERDRNGNCYHFAHVTRTKDGVTFTTEVGGDSNAACAARNAGLEWGDFIKIQSVVPKKQFRFLSKGVPYREPELQGFFKGEVEGEPDHYTE